jgi:diguanylate cyclase (GGDEF)-like protein
MPEFGGHLISLRKYLELEPEELKLHTEPDPRELFSAALLAAYRNLLGAVGMSGRRATEVLDFGLEKNLGHIAATVTEKSSDKGIHEAEAKAEKHLERWSEEAAAYLQAKAAEVKGLLVVLMAAAEAASGHHQRYVARLGKITERLESLKSLEDLGRIRAALDNGVSELQCCTQQMNREGRASVAELQAEIKTYQEKLEMAETLAARDSLTGLLNRRSVEERVQQRLAQKQSFCLLLIDMDGFKGVNDRYGHLAGDSCLAQFAAELRMQSRATDTVGRWGGDEFMVVLDGSAEETQAYVERVRQWVFGNYAVEHGGETRKVKLWASIGMARALPTDTVASILQRADAAMYEQKRVAPGARDKLSYFRSA